MTNLGYVHGMCIQWYKSSHPTASHHLLTALNMNHHTHPAHEMRVAALSRPWLSSVNFLGLVSLGHVLFDCGAHQLLIRMHEHLS